jgi:hypothetical protein
LGFERKREEQYYRDGAVNSKEDEGRRDMVYWRQRCEMGEGREGGRKKGREKVVDRIGKEGGRGGKVG